METNKRTNKNQQPKNTDNVGAAKQPEMIHAPADYQGVFLDAE